MKYAILMPHGADLLRCLERVRSAQNTEESTSCTLSTTIEPDSRGTSPAMTANDNGSSPERTEPEAEREWRRRIIRIWPVVIRPRVIIGIRPVVRTIAVAVVTAVIAACTEIGGIRFGRGLRFRLRGRVCCSNRGRTSKRQGSRNGSHSNQRLHVSFPLATRFV